MEQTKRERRSPVRQTARVLRLLFFLSPLPALPLFLQSARQHFPTKSQRSLAGATSLPCSLAIVSSNLLPQKSPKQTAKASDTDPTKKIVDEAVAGLGGLRTLSPRRGDVEVLIGAVPGDLLGIPIQRLSEAIESKPHAHRFHVTWFHNGPSCVDYYAIWYDREKHTLRHWYYSQWLDAGPPTCTWSIYQKVKDAVINSIADKDIHEDGVARLPDYGCTCRGTGCPAK